MNKNFSGVYKITNLSNGKIYVGSAKNFNKRKYVHFYNLIKNTHKNKHLQASFNKYGKKSFVFEVVEHCPVDKLLKIEQKYLDKYFDEQNQCYNKCKIAGNTLGYKHTLETKEKLSSLHKRKKLSKQTREKMSKSKKGKKMHTEEHKEKLFKNFSGENNPGFGKCGSKSATAKQVYQYDLKGNFVKKWESQIEASKELNICKTSISSCCNGKLKKAGNYIWSFEFL